MIQITLKGSVPSKKNSKQIKFRGGRPTLLSSDAHQAWYEEMLYTSGIKRAKKVKGPVHSVSITFYIKTKQKADLSNKAESVMDLLVAAGIIEDDNMFIVPNLLLYFGGVDPKNPRAEILIED